MITIDDISMAKVLDFVPSKRAVIYKTGIKHNPVDVFILDERDFNRFKFKAIKWIKRKKEPEDRMWPFEAEVLGIWSYSKEKKLIESRKTREEKSAELQEQIEFNKELKKRGLL